MTTIASTPLPRPSAAREPGHPISQADPSPADEDWLTAAVRPVGTFGRDDTGRLGALLQALSACASIVVLDLASARLRGRGAARVIDEAAGRLIGRGGCLLCVNVDEHSRACLAQAGDRAVVVAAGEPAPATEARPPHIGLTGSRQVGHSA